MVLGICIFLIAVVAALAVWRWTDLRQDAREMDRLRTFADPDPARFDPAMVADLPDPARRFFLAAITPGTPLHRVAEFHMSGQFDLGSKEAPKPLDMTAHQVIAGLQGFLWQARMGGGMPVSGSDSEGWMRFWLAGLVPVVRAGGDADHDRSAFGRTVAEAVIWLPTSVLPQPGIEWSAVDENTARVTIQRGPLEQSADITLNAEGHPTSIVVPRWSNANPDKRFQVQPFGGTLSDYRDFGGVTVPARAEVGNHFGTPDYFPFFIATLTDLTYPAGD